MSYDDAIRWKTLGGQPLNPLTLGLTEWSRPQGGSHDESQSLSDLNSTTPTHVSVSLVCPFLPIKSVENWAFGNQNVTLVFNIFFFTHSIQNVILSNLLIKIFVQIYIWNRIHETYCMVKLPKLTLVAVVTFNFLLLWILISTNCFLFFNKLAVMIVDDLLNLRCLSLFSSS